MQLETIDEKHLQFVHLLQSEHCVVSFRLICWICYHLLHYSNISKSKVPEKKHLQFFASSWVMNLRNYNAVNKDTNSFCLLLNKTKPFLVWTVSHTPTWKLLKSVKIEILMLSQSSQHKECNKLNTMCRLVLANTHMQKHAFIFPLTHTHTQHGGKVCQLQSSRKEEAAGECDVMQVGGNPGN